MQRGPGLWRFDNALLHREDFKEKIREVIRVITVELLAIIVKHSARVKGVTIGRT